MKNICTAFSVFALLLGITCLGSKAAYGAPEGSRAQGYGQDRDHHDWDTPPGELNEIQRRGFHDGMDGARHDIENQRQPNVLNRDEYRHPQLPEEQWEAYRQGFRRGYALAISHLAGGQPQVAPPPPPMQRSEPMGNGWGGVPGQFSDIQRRGYQDGTAGAQRDAENHRRPDPNNRDEYRNPNVPPPLVDEYREGFRRGYEQSVAQMFGGAQPGQWDAAPGQFGDMQRQGFQDGVQGARRDMENHRRPDPNNRDEYRNPNVPPPLVDEYREGFRRGYERAMAHLMGDPDRH